MTSVTCTKDVWVEIATAVTEFNFNLTNHPDVANKRAYYVATGSSTPADESTALYYEMLKETNKPISYNNSVAENIYVKAIYDDGKVIY